jgi:hypothetical protein
MASSTAWSADPRSVSKAEEVEVCVTMMMEGLATVGDADFPQTATNISGCGWSNDSGGWSIDTLDDGALPENLHPPLCAARDVLNKYNAVVVRTVNLGKRKQADVEVPEEDTADQMFNEGIDAAARGPWPAKRETESVGSKTRYLAD